MTQFIYNGTQITPKNGWVVIDSIRMKLKKAKALDGFEIITPVSSHPPQPPSAQQLQERFARDVHAQVADRIGAVASTATQINIAAAAAGNILTDAQMSAYLAGLNWINEMRETGKQLILDADGDFALDEKWPPIPEGVIELFEAF